MNKKLIAIAIASVMAAPVAMADLKISGRFAGHLTNDSKEVGSSAADKTKAATTFGESGASRIQFDGTSGKAFGRIAYVQGGTAGFKGSRDLYLGYKFGFGTVSFGRIGGVAKNIEKDALITTFLQLRKTNAEAATGTNYGSSGFVNDVIQVSAKVGGAKIKLQFNPQDNTNRGSSGHVGIGITGKAGPVGYFAAHSNGDGTTKTTAATAAVTAVTGVVGTTTVAAVAPVSAAAAVAASTSTIKQTNTKIGASMKFGAAKVTLMNTTSEDKTDGFDATAVHKKIATVLMANIGLGKGLAVDVAASTGDVKTATTTKKNTWNRLAISKKINKGFMVYGGVTTSKTDGSDTTTRTGVGAILKF